MADPQNKFSEPHRPDDTAVDLSDQQSKAAELARKRDHLYRCWDCGQEFSIQLTGSEERGSLAEGHTEACPRCGQTVGMGRVSCRRCQGAFVLTVPHWHVSCDVAWGNCPQCGEAYRSLCIC